MKSSLICATRRNLTNEKQGKRAKSQNNLLNFPAGYFCKLNADTLNISPVFEVSLFAKKFCADADQRNSTLLSSLYNKLLEKHHDHCQNKTDARIDHSSSEGNDEEK